MLLGIQLIYFIVMTFVVGILYQLQLPALTNDMMLIFVQLIGNGLLALVWYNDYNRKEIKEKVIEQSDKPIHKRKTFMRVDLWITLVLIYLTSEFSMYINNTFIYYISNIITFGITFMIIYPLIVESNIGFKKTGLLKIVVYAFLAIVFSIVFNNLYDYLVSFFYTAPTDSVNQIVVEESILGEPLKMFVSVTFYAAIMEEAVFRGLSFRTLVHRNRFFAYLLSFLIFGGIHLMAGFMSGSGLEELIFLPVYGVMGLTFAFLYEKTETIYTPMLAHFINNLWSFVLILLFP